MQRVSYSKYCVMKWLAKYGIGNGIFSVAKLRAKGDLEFIWSGLVAKKHPRVARPIFSSLGREEKAPLQLHYNAHVT